MYEIEIKAHVYNRDKVISILNSFAEYQCYIEKKDNYFRFPVSSEGEKPVTVRIRKEKIRKNKFIFRINLYACTIF